MAVYKLIQDVEAEDKLIGPLTLKGFIYALAAGLLAFINIKLFIATDLGAIRWLVIIILGFPMLLLGVLASPLGGQQPTEVWLLARVRFLLKARQMIWDQAAVDDMVTITAPPKVEQHLTKELSQSEVHGRLKTLALTLDSRGWAVKDVSLNDPLANFRPEDYDKDRLVAASTLPQSVPAVQVNAADDILDEQHNPMAQKLLGLIKRKDAERKKEISEKFKAAQQDTPPASPPAALPRRKVGHPAYDITEDEDVLNAEFRKAETAFRAEHGGPAGANPTLQSQTANPEVTARARAAKLELAQSGNDLSVASIERLANRQPKIQKLGPGEVLISLH